MLKVKVEYQQKEQGYRIVHQNYAEPIMGGVADVLEAKVEYLS